MVGVLGTHGLQYISINKLQFVYSIQKGDPDGIPNRHCMCISTVYCIQSMVDHKKHFKADLTDRTVFWEILRSKRRNDHRLTRRLESSLSDHKRRCVRQIAKHQAFYNAFDKLSRIPGLRLGLVIGNLHRLITLKCDEVGVLSCVK